MYKERLQYIDADKFHELEKVNLTQIPFHAIYPNEPYPNVTAEILPFTKSHLNINFYD